MNNPNLSSFIWSVADLLRVTTSNPSTAVSKNPLSEFKREVLPPAPDAWIDHEKTEVGYEIPFNRHFHVFKSPRPLREIDAELKGVTDRILTMIAGLSK